MKRKTNVVAIIQARIGATRLPRKVMADIAGHPMLWHVVSRLRECRSVSRVAVATSTADVDDAIASFCKGQSIDCYRGAEDDVLDRFYRAAMEFAADPVVRVTSDCPLIDPQIVDKVVGVFLQDGSDYVANILRYTYPDGMDVEVFSFAALKATWQEATLRGDREHVTPYMRSSGRFRLLNVENDKHLPEQHRWTVDEAADLEFVRAVYNGLSGNGRSSNMEEVLSFLDKNPQIAAINRRIVRNAGYYRSLAEERPMNPTRRDLTNSRELLARARRVIPSGTQTFSKGPTQFVQGVAPTYLARGQGSHVWDVDGNEYVDWSMGLGPVILGHNYEAVSRAVKRQVDDGVAFSLPHPLELDVAELLVQTIPCAEMVRYGKNGSDVTSGAIRLARAFTGRDIVACCGYHGWQDWYIGTTTRRKGVPKVVQELTIPFAYNAPAGLKRIFDLHRGQVAAVIMEPIGIVEPRDGFLEEVREMTRAEGAILIYDEVITGFRIALGGAQQFFGVKPDLACFGKALANGYPLAAIVGRRDIMEVFDQVFFSFTFGGETLSLAAAAATIQEMRDKNVIAHLWEQGSRLKDGYTVLAREFGIQEITSCEGLPPRTVVQFK
ncbi:MAG: aminotransferase class III-fold pyridoxal phosphate-dependent enzyme, partial [Vicinamibacteria bacterium]